MCLCCVAPSNTKAVAFADEKISWCIDQLTCWIIFSVFIILKLLFAWKSEIMFDLLRCDYNQADAGWWCSKWVCCLFAIHCHLLSFMLSCDNCQVCLQSSWFRSVVFQVCMCVLSNLAIHCNLLWFILICDNCQVLQFKNIKKYRNTIQINLTVVW